MIDKSELQRLVNLGKSQRQIAEILCCQQISIRYWLKKHGLKTKRSEPKPEKPKCALEGCSNVAKHFPRSVCCCMKHVNQKRRLDLIKSWLAGEKVTRGFAVLRQYLFEIHRSSCQKCGWSQVNPVTGRVPLQINHIDGNGDNWHFSNIELICPNCHALTPTFGALNNGNSCQSRRTLRIKTAFRVVSEVESHLAAS